MTLEELEIVVKADITDVTQKLNQLKAQLQDKVQQATEKAVAQIKPNIESVKSTVTSTTNIASKEIELLTRKIEIQAKKVRELRKNYQEEMQYAKAYAESGTKNWALPEVDTARTKYQQAEIQLEKMQLQASKMRNKFSEAGETAKKSGEKIEKAMKKSSNATQKADKHTSKFLRTFKRIAKIMLIHSIINSAVEGFQDLAIANQDFNKAMSQMQSALLQARNSIATAFAPALEELAPIVVKVAEAISWLFTEISMWANAFAGNSSYTRAKKVTTDYATSLGKANKEQQKANAEQKKMLAGFDELNVIMEKSSQGLSTSTGLPTAQEMFEEVAIPQDIIDKATFIKQKLEEMLPIIATIGGIIAGWKVGKEIDNIGKLLGLWGDSKTKVNNLTDAFKGKNEALGQQQGEYQKEYSWLKNLVPKFLGAGAAVGLLGWALKNLKENPIEMPSTQPVLDLESTFETAKENIGTSMDGVRESVATNVNSAVQVIEEAKPVIETNVMSAGDTIIEGSKRVNQDIETKNHAISQNIHDTIVKNKQEIEIGIADQTAIAQNGYAEMAQSADDMSFSIQKSIATFVKRTGENISKWVTYVISPAIELMKEMNIASGEKMFELKGVKSAVKSITSGVKNITKNIVQPVKEKIQENLKATYKASQFIGSNVGNWVGMATGIGAKTGVDNVKDGALISGILGAGTYALTTGDTSMLDKLVPAMANGGVVNKPTLALVGENTSTIPEIVAPQSLLLQTSTQANVPVMNSIEEMGDKLVQALNSIGVYAEFDYSKLKVGLDNENYRAGGKLYGV